MKRSYQNDNYEQIKKNKTIILKKEVPLKNNSYVEEEITNVIIYIRVSSKPQETDAQEYSCVEYCKKHNYNILKIVKEDKISAYKGNKQKKLHNILSNELNIILLVNEIDRLSRNANNGNKFIEKMLKNNIILKSVKETFIFKTPEGQHEVRKLISAAQASSEKISLKIKNNKRYKKSKNQFIGGTTKYGFKIINKKQVLDPLEQSVITFVSKNLYKKRSSKEITLDLYVLLTKFDKPKDFYVPVEFLEEAQSEHSSCAGEINDNDSELSEDLLEGYFDEIYSEEKKILITTEILSNILNDYEIEKRNKLWTPNKIKYIYKKIDYNIILDNLFNLTL